MNVIIEGPDGAGKTTFAKSIVGKAYRHEGPPPKYLDLIGYYRRLVDSSKNTIFDRHALSELVYGPLLRGSSRISLEEIEVYYRFEMENTRLVICLPPPDICHANWAAKAERNQELITDASIWWKTYAAYAFYAHRLNFGVYDYTQGDKSL